MVLVPFVGGSKKIELNKGSVLETNQAIKAKNTLSLQDWPSSQKWD